MGSPPAPIIANGWLSKYDNKIKDNALLFSRYMDDILCNIKKYEVHQKLEKIIALHPALKSSIP